MARHGRPTRAQGEKADKYAGVDLVSAELEHDANTEQWRVGKHVKVIARRHGDELVALGVGIDGTELTEPQVRGLIVALHAAHGRTWPGAYE